MYKDIKNYEGEYQINEKGDVKSLSRFVPNSKVSKRFVPEKILSPKTKNNGYKEVSIKRKMFYVHRLVAETFIGKIKKGYNVNHKDGIKANNCVSNLEIVTLKENSLHAYKTGLSSIPQPRQGSDHHNSKLNEKTVLVVRNDYAFHKSISKLCRSFSWIPKSTLCKIVYRKTWKHI